MVLTEKIQRKIWSFGVLFPVAVASLMYILLKRDFAKVYFEFSFLKAPVFIGEVLLIFCLASLVVYWIKFPPRYNQWFLLIIIYVVWFLFKLITGYYHWGPLAFRHAALFYYPFFFIVGFVFFNRDLFTKDTVLILITMIMGIFVSGHFDHYWSATLTSLGFILILALKDRKWQIFMSLAFVTTIPYIFLFKTARMMVVGNIASTVLIMVGVLCLLQTRIYIKIAILILVVIGGTIGFYKFFILGESGRTFSSPRQVITTFMEMDRDVQQKEKSYKKQIMIVGLYHPTKSSSEFYYYVDPHKGKKKAKVIEVSKTPPKEKISFHCDSLMRTDDGNVSKELDVPPAPVGWVSNNNIVFRLFIWRDMFRDWNVHKPIMGVDFGKPFLSPSLVVLHWAESEWGRDGWIEPHNSFFHMLYRAGIVGVVLVIFIWGGFIWFVKLAFERRSWILILLAAIMLNWMVAANFLLILEVPYTAIPFWTIAGLAFAYACRDTNTQSKGAYEIKR